MSWLLLFLLGGAVGVDGASLGQVMISRPLVAGALAGSLLGRPVEGLLIGAVLEVFSMVVLPVGAARYPESGTGAAAAAAALALGAPEAAGAGPLVMAVIFALLWEQVGGATVYQLRLFNERLVGGPAAGGLFSAGRLERRHMAAVAVDVLRGAVVTAVGAAVGGALIRLLAPLWSIGSATSLIVLGVATAAMLGAVLGIFGGVRERWAPFLIGAGCGTALLLL